MITGCLEKRIFRIGDRPMLVVNGDSGEALSAVGLRCIDDSRVEPDAGAVGICILGGRACDVARVNVPPDAYDLFVTRRVLIRADERHRYGDWFGKARSVVSPSAGLGIILVPGIKNYNRDFLARLIVRPIIDRLLSARGYTPLHAAAAVSGGSGCLVVGDGGAGKTTLLCGLLKSGMGFLSDDRVYIARGHGTGCRIDGVPEVLRIAHTKKGPKHPVAPPGGVSPSASPDMVFFLEKRGRADDIFVSRISSAEASARLIRYLPPFTERDTIERAIGHVSDICKHAGTYCVGGWGDPAERLDAVLDVLSAAG